MTHRFYSGWIPLGRCPDFPRSASLLLNIYGRETSRPPTRFEGHNDGLSTATKPYRPWLLIFYEAYVSKRDAKRREMYLKTSKGRTTIKTMLSDTLNS
jgi:putative endonuclease